MRYPSVEVFTGVSDSQMRTSGFNLFPCALVRAENPGACFSFVCHAGVSGYDTELY